MDEEVIGMSAEELDRVSIIAATSRRVGCVSVMRRFGSRRWSWCGTATGASVRRGLLCAGLRDRTALPMD